MNRPRSIATDADAEEQGVTIRVPLSFRRRGGRKQVVAPNGASFISPGPRVDSTLIKVIARAHRWQRMLDQGTYASLRDLAAAECISPTYVSRLLRLTLLAPAIVEAALIGGQPVAINSGRLGQPIEDVWGEQDRLRPTEMKTVLCDRQT